MTAFDTEAFLAAQFARPMTHVVITKFASGKERRWEVRSLGAANNHAHGEKRKIGKDLISHGDNIGHVAGEIVRVVSVEIIEL